MDKTWQHDRRSRHERGYGTAWDRIRLVILRRDGYRCRCEECTRTGMLKPANEVDHVLSKANWLKRHGTMSGCDDPSNLQAINKNCHERKSLIELGKKPQPKVRIGPDGFPCDE